MLYTIRANYYSGLYFKELKTAADSGYETIKDFIIKMGSRNLTKLYELTRQFRFKKNGEIITYEQFLNNFYSENQEIKSFVIRKYGMETYKLYLRAGGLDANSKQIAKGHNEKDDAVSTVYANEIQNYLHELGCSLTKTGYMFSLALKRDRNSLEQAISLCVFACVENYLQIENKIGELSGIDKLSETNIFMMKVSEKVKDYHENALISKLAYQSVISLFSTCLNLEKTNEDKALLQSVAIQNYLNGEQLAVIDSTC